MDLQSIISFFDSLYMFVFKVVGCEPAFIITVIIVVSTLARVFRIRDRLNKDKNLILGGMSFLISLIFIVAANLGKEGIPIGDILSQTFRLSAVSSLFYQLIKSYSKLVVRIILKMLADRAGVELTSSETKSLEEDSEEPSETVAKL